MISILYEEPQYLSVMLRKAEADEVDRLVAVICDRIYANHYKARDEYYVLALIMHATGEDMSNITEPTNILAQVRSRPLLIRPRPTHAQHHGPHFTQPPFTPPRAGQLRDLDLA